MSFLRKNDTDVINLTLSNILVIFNYRARRINYRGKAVIYHIHTNMTYISKKVMNRKIKYKALQNGGKDKMCKMYSHLVFIYIFNV